MVQDQENYRIIISDENRKRICVYCYAINNILIEQCKYCLQYLPKFPNQLDKDYYIDFSKSSSGAIYFYNHRVNKSFWFPY